jgi:hypothetical protein
MNTGCEEGLRLRKRYEKDLIKWGWFEAYEKAVELIPVGFPRVLEFQKQARSAESSLFKSRHAYAEHMAHCLVCSRRLVMPDAVSLIHQKLKRVFEESQGV